MKHEADQAELPNELVTSVTEAAAAVAPPPIPPPPPPPPPPAPPSPDGRWTLCVYQNFSEYGFSSNNLNFSETFSSNKCLESCGPNTFAVTLHLKAIYVNYDVSTWLLKQNKLSAAKMSDCPAFKLVHLPFFRICAFMLFPGADFDTYNLLLHRFLTYVFVFVLYRIANSPTTTSPWVW